MSENYMESIAKLLGVRLGEKFIVTHKGKRHSELYYCLTKYGLSVIGTDFYDNSILTSLLTGFYKIKKISWKPEYKEWYYTFSFINGKVEVNYVMWYGNERDIINYRLGFCYHSNSEAEYDLPRAEKFFNNLQVIDWDD